MVFALISKKLKDFNCPRFGNKKIHGQLAIVGD
jgi:hypothetical protein